MSFPSSPDHNLVLLLLRHRRLLTFFELLAFLDFFLFCLLFGLFMFFCCFVFGCWFFFCSFACDLIWICFPGGFQGGREGGDKGGVGKWINVNNNIKKKLHSYEKQQKKRLRFLWIKKCSFFFFLRKNNNLWQSDFHTVSFSFVSSSFLLYCCYYYVSSFFFLLHLK